ncbi:MAG: serine/threonine protein kinase [Candidatus Obscuribacterales bacterium]|nr:serine/threonine protein kinase [Candidatus Obscuribacterales bacterium]
MTEAIPQLPISAASDEGMEALSFFAQRHKLSYSHPIFRRFKWTTSTGLSWAIVLLGSPIIGLVVFVMSMAMPTFMVLAICGLMTLTGGYLLSGAWLGNTTISFDSEGILFPLCLSRQLHGHLYREWSDLKVLVFVDRNVPSENPTKIKLGFKDDAHALLNIDGFNRAELELLFLAIDTYSPKLYKLPDPQRVKLSASWKGDEVVRLGFTELWNESLSSRFGSTAFVPLECGATLRNGSIKVLGNKAFGGLSAVYLAKLESGEFAALKECVTQDLGDPEALSKSREMFEREAKILAGLDHPRIAKVIDYFVENGRHYLVLQHIVGKNLRNIVMDQGPQSEDIVWDWASQLTEIVDYLHSLEPPVVHRDITPDNIILAPDGSLYLIDFGAANTFIGTATGTVVGKSSYIPLEQFKGKACPASDVFAFGATLYFFTTGRDPKPLSECDAIADGGKISVSLNDLIKQCTKVDVDERLSQVRAAVRDGRGVVK